jgi:hypothetical protein
MILMRTWLTLRRKRGLDYTFNVDVTSYRDGIRRTHNSNRDGSTGRANADEVRSHAVRASHTDVAHGTGLSDNGSTCVASSGRSTATRRPLRESDEERLPRAGLAAVRGGLLNPSAPSAALVRPALEGALQHSGKDGRPRTVLVLFMQEGTLQHRLRVDTQQRHLRWNRKSQL